MTFCSCQVPLQQRSCVMSATEQDSFTFTGEYELHILPSSKFKAAKDDAENYMSQTASS